MHIGRAAPHLWEEKEAVLFFSLLAGFPVCTVRIRTCPEKKGEKKFP